MADGPKLKKSLTLFDVYAISTGAMFSSGFFLLPGIAFLYAGPSVFLAYLLAAVAAAGNDASSYQPPRPPDEGQKALLKEMQAKVAACAEDLDIAAETVASKRELSAVVISGNRRSRVFTGWRAELIGDELLALL